jgi:uncharacterized membrane protein YhaH (DUF805 family)
MDLDLFTSTQGRLAPKPFWLALAAIYVAGFASQFLLSADVRVRAGLSPFMVAQAVLIWAWLALHIKRLRDGGQGPAGAIGVAIIYTLAIVLLLMLVAFLTGPETGGVQSGTPESDTASNRAGALFLLLALLTIVFSHDFGVFMTILKVLIVMACLPALISVAFSIYAGLRPRIAP